MGLWIVMITMALTLPIGALIAQGTPVKEQVLRTVIAQCPVSESQNCLAAADLLGAVGAFYEVVIMILIALLAAAVSLVYLSIRASSKRQVEEQFTKEMEGDYFKHQLQREAERAADKTNSELFRRIEVLEKRLANTGLESESVPETHVVDQGD